MNQIIDVEYRAIEEFKEKTTEELVAEANTLYGQMETIGTIGLMIAADAGKRLIEIKKRIGHGNWENWIKENCKFSQRKANYMIQLAEKSEENPTLFSKTQTFADIGISKVWELISAPEQVAETVIESTNLEDVTVRELKEEIKATKEAYNRLTDDIQKLQAENTQAKEEIEELQKELNEVENKEGSDPEEIKLLEEALKEKEEQIKEINKQQKKLIAEEKEKIKASNQKELELANKKIEEEKAKTEAEIKKKQAAEELVKKLQEESEQLKKQNVVAGNETLTKIKIYSEEFQAQFQKCRELVLTADESIKPKLIAYMNQVISNMKMNE